MTKALLKKWIIIVLTVVSFEQLYSEDTLSNTVYESDEASKYSQLSLLGEGTLYLSFRDLEALIRKHLPHHSLHSLKAIDYGCGAGRSTRYLKSLGINEVDGFDISEKMIQQSQAFDTKGNYQLINSAHVPVSDSYYDMALMSFVTVAIDQKEEMTRVFKELSRVLKKDGVIASITLSETFWDPAYKWVTYFQNYPENYSRTSGQKLRLKINSIDLELTDCFGLVA